MASHRYEMRLARKEAELQAHYRLRYEVYVEEMHSVGSNELSPEDHAARLERDWYDQYAIHFVVQDRKTKEYVGAVRLIPDTPRGFLMEQRFPLPKEVDRSKTMELSRFLIVKDKRNGGEGLDRHELAIGLFRWCEAHGITTWCSAMQARLLYALLDDGITFTIIGPPDRHYHNTVVLPVLLYDLNAAIRHLWVLNRPLHFRYTNGKGLPPTPQDETDRARKRIERYKRLLRLAKRGSVSRMIAAARFLLSF